MNKVILIGRAGKDPEIRGNDKKVASFSLATSKKYKGEEQTDWHNIVSFFQAEFCRDYVKKGDLLSIEGEIRYRSYEAQGQTKYITEIVARDIQKLVWEKKTMTVAAAKDQAETDELPF